MKVLKFRKKPIEVEAVQYDGTNAQDLFKWTNGFVQPIDPEDRGDDPDCDLSVFDTLHNTWVLVYRDQWIIKGIKGEFYPCEDEVFKETYEQI